MKSQAYIDGMFFFHQEHINLVTFGVTNPLT